VENRTVTLTNDAANGDIIKASYEMPVPGGGTTTLETDYSYTRFGDVETVAAPGAQPTSFQTDDLGRLTGVSETDAGIFDAPHGFVSNNADNGVWTKNKNHTFTWGASESSTPVDGYSFSQDVSAPQTVSTTSPTATWNNVGDGQHTAHVRARNTSGFWSPEAVFDLWVDTALPVASNWSVSPNPIQTALPVTVTVTITDALSGTVGQTPRLRWCISGDASRPWSAYSTMTNVSTDVWRAEINGNWTANAGKTLYYQVEANDVAGNFLTTPEQSLAISGSGGGGTGTPGDIPLSTPQMLMWMALLLFVVGAMNLGGRRRPAF